jgi:hypothetical protein
VRGGDRSWYCAWVTRTGYPQPEDSYEDVTYDTTDYCQRCAIGAVQRHPFRLKGEWKGRNVHFRQLYWVGDEIFVRPEVGRLLKRRGIRGIALGPVTTGRDQRRLESIEQLLISTILPGGLVTDGLPTVTCKARNEESHLGGPSWDVPGSIMRYPRDYPYCGRLKYHWQKTLRIRRRAFTGAPDVVKTREWFGSGGEASRQILVSDRVVDLVTKAGWRGLRLDPVEIVG